MHMYAYNTYLVHALSLSVVSMYVYILLYVTVRLVNGPTEYEGRVEVLYNDEWSTVCDNEWDLKQAQVVCNELGVGRAVAAKRDAFYGEGSGKIWLDNVNCIGTELNIKHCSHTRRFQTCGHDKDVGVQCTSGMHVHIMQKYLW